MRVASFVVVYRHAYREGFTEGGPFLLEGGGRSPLVEPVPASYPLRQVPLGGDDICETYMCHGLVIHLDFTHIVTRRYVRAAPAPPAAPLTPRPWPRPWPGARC